MKMWSTGSMVLVATLLLAFEASPAEPWLAPDQFGSVCIVVAASASLSEQTAAKEFQNWWEQCTGHTAPVGTSPRDGSVAVWIGRTGVPDALLASVNLDGLGDDGLCIRTATPRDLLVVGGQKRGTLYGVYQFFEDYMGVRWLAPDATYIPPVRKSIPPINFRHVPPFQYRDTDYWMFAWHPDFAVKHRLNGNYVFRIPEHLGGNIEPVNATSNTLLSFLHPEEYGETHPEYFSEVRGQRIIVPQDTQLCLTNPDVLRIVTGRTLDMLRQSPPDRHIVTIAQMRTGAFCECAGCRAVRDREGSDSGVLLEFVNQVADSVAAEFPDARIKTSAFGPTLQPPKSVRPRPNVMVEICTEGWEFSRPYPDSSDSDTRTFRKHLQTWDRMTDALFVWDFTQNRSSFLQPHPNVDVLQPNVAFFARSGVTGLFAQGSRSPHSDFDMLKAYILAHAVWNPDVDGNALYTEFMDLYYGAASPYLREYLDLTKSAVLDTDWKLTATSSMEWVTFDLVEQAKALFREAYAAVGDDAVLRRRVDHAYLPVQHAALVCPPKLEMLDDRYLVTRPPSQTFDEYWDMLMAYGVTHNGDGPLLEFRAQLNGQTPPRRQEVRIQRIENKHWEVHASDDLSGAIVSLRAKRAGLDWFRPEKAVGGASHRLQDWEVMDPDNPVREEAIGTPYTLVAQTSERLTYETRLDNGLVVRRTVILEPRANEVALIFEMVNTGHTPLIPRVKPHPEFWTQGDYPPEFWVERHGTWRMHGGPAHILQRTGGGMIAPDDVTRWALHIPGKRLTLVNTIQAGEVQNLFFYFDLDRQVANLEVVPLQAPLNPGETRTIHLSYKLSEKPPRSL